MFQLAKNFPKKEATIDKKSIYCVSDINFDKGAYMRVRNMLRLEVV